jgi:hypothetical protein
MSRKFLGAACAALFAVVAGAPAARAASQTKAIPGVATVTVSDGPDTIDFTIAAPSGRVTDASFDAAVFLTTQPSTAGGALSLRAHGTGSDVSFSAVDTIASTQTCQQIDGVNVHANPAVGARVSPDGSAVLFQVPRSQFFRGQPPHFVWAALNPSLFGPADACPGLTPDGHPSAIPGYAGLSYDMLSLSAGGEYTADPPPAPDPPVDLTSAPPTLRVTTVGDKQVTISWVGGAFHDGFLVTTLPFGGDPATDGDLYDVKAATTYTVKGLTNGVAYQLSVQGYRNHAGRIQFGSLASVAATPHAATDKDADGISNDWTKRGKPIAAPKRPTAAKVTSTSVRLSLPPAPKGAQLRVYRKQPNGSFKADTTTAKRTVTIKGLEPATAYQFKLVAVNHAGRQTAASKPITFKTNKH